MTHPLPFCCRVQANPPPAIRLNGTIASASRSCRLLARAPVSSLSVCCQLQGVGRTMPKPAQTEPRGSRGRGARAGAGRRGAGPGGAARGPRRGGYGGEGGDAKPPVRRSMTLFPGGNFHCTGWPTNEAHTADTEREGERERLNWGGGTGMGTRTNGRSSKEREEPHGLRCGWRESDSPKALRTSLRFATLACRPTTAVTTQICPCPSRAPRTAA